MSGRVIGQVNVYCVISHWCGSIGDGVTGKCGRTPHPDASKEHLPELTSARALSTFSRYRLLYITTGAAKVRPKKLNAKALYRPILKVKEVTQADRN